MGICWNLIHVFHLKLLPYFDKYYVKFFYLSHICQTGLWALLLSIILSYYCTIYWVSSFIKIGWWDQRFSSHISRTARNSYCIYLKQTENFFHLKVKRRCPRLYASTVNFKVLCLHNWFELGNAFWHSSYLLSILSTDSL